MRQSNKLVCYVSGNANYANVGFQVLILCENDTFSSLAFEMSRVKWAGLHKLQQYLANGAGHEAEGDPGPEPAVLQNTTGTLEVEHVTAVQLRKITESTHRTFGT